MLHPQTLFKVWEEDMKAVTAREFIRDKRCIHCGDKYINGAIVSYTELSNGKIIFWHKEHIINDYD